MTAACGNAKSAQKMARIHLFQQDSSTSEEVVTQFYCVHDNRESWLTFAWLIIIVQAVISDDVLWFDLLCKKQNVRLRRWQEELDNLAENTPERMLSFTCLTLSISLSIVLPVTQYTL